MQVEKLDDAISVRADFAGGEITPLMFKRRGKVSRVTAVNARWRDSDGAHPVHCFSVQTSEDTTCYLRFDTASGLWRLEQVILPG